MNLQKFISIMYFYQFQQLLFQQGDMIGDIQKELKNIHQLIAQLRDQFKQKGEQFKIANIKNSMNQENMDEFVANIRTFFKDVKKLLAQTLTQFQALKDIYNSQKSQLPVDLKKLYKNFKQKKDAFQTVVDELRKVINAKKNKLQQMKKISNQAQQIFQKENASYVRMANSLVKIISLVQTEQLKPNAEDQQSKQESTKSINISKISKVSKQSSLNMTKFEDKLELSALSNQSVSPDLYCPKRHKLKKMIDSNREVFNCDMCQKQYQIKFSGNQCKSCNYCLCMFCSAKIYKSFGQNLHLQKDNSFGISLNKSSNSILDQISKDQIKFNKQKLQNEQLSTLKKYKKLSKQSFVQSEIKFEKKQSLKGNVRQVSSVLSSKIKEKVEQQKQLRKRCPNCKKAMKSNLKICERCQDPEDY